MRTFLALSQRAVVIEPDPDPGCNRRRKADEPGICKFVSSPCLAGEVVFHGECALAYSRSGIEDLAQHRRLNARDAGRQHVGHMRSELVDHTTVVIGHTQNFTRLDMDAVVRKRRKGGRMLEQREV